MPRIFIPDAVVPGTNFRHNDRAEGVPARFAGQALPTGGIVVALYQSDRLMVYGGVGASTCLVGDTSLDFLYGLFESNCANVIGGAAIGA